MLMETRATVFAEVNAALQRMGGTKSIVSDAIKVIADGGIVVVSDSEDRENEADLIMAAEHATTEAMAFILRYTTGIVCVAIDDARAEALNLPYMVEHGTDPNGTAFTVSCDARRGVTTGVSAADRTETVRILGDPRAKADDLTRPGHIFPLRARRQGVLQRMGHTEAAYDLARVAGCTPAGVLCELSNDDGTMMRGQQVAEFAAHHGLLQISISDIVQWRIFNGT